MQRDAVIRALAAAGCIAPAAEADELIGASGGDADVLAQWVGRRTMGEPIAWLTGKVTFCGLGLEIGPGVYVPREQSEALARRAASLLPLGAIAADICTGMGAIAAVLAAGDPTARVVGTELDPTAAMYARRNGVEVFEGYLDEPLPLELKNRIDVMTAVVPYVPTDDIRLLPRDVQSFEPRLALDGGRDGCVLLRAVALGSPTWLRPGGLLLLELGGDQADVIGDLLEGVGFGDVLVLSDGDGDPRGICARFAGKD